MQKLVCYLLPRNILVAVVLFITCHSTLADEVRVAVASNFISTMKVLADQFARQTGHDVVLSSGSTGKHFAQISNGAPFDIFFAADVVRPALLEDSNKTLPNTRFTYAIGRLVLWSTKNDYVDANGTVLVQGNFNRLAIANPKLAPYGKAAQQVLKAKGLWKKFQASIIRGENVSQALQYVYSGNAQLGFVALSQILDLKDGSRGSYWIVDPSEYDPIEQQAVLLTEKPAARLFLMFVTSKDGRAIIKRKGYDVP